jgi:hypothetical protein
VPRERVAGFEPVAVELPALVADGTGGIKGRRKSRKDKLRELLEIKVRAAALFAGVTGKALLESADSKASAAAAAAPSAGKGAKGAKGGRGGKLH